MRRKSIVSLMMMIIISVLPLLGKETVASSSINGFVADKATKETLIGVSVSLEGTKFGAVTNVNGFFVITGVPEGAYKLRVSFIGYKKEWIDVVLKNDENKRLSIELVSENIETKEIVVEADKKLDEKREITMSRVNLPMEQIQQLRIGGEADVFRALQYLPGVLTSSQISSGLFIRGGSPDQTLVLLDGSTVYNPAHLFGFFSSFNPDAIKDVDLIKGGFPAEYGGRMAAVLNLTQKDGNQEKFEGVVSAGLIAARTSLQGPIGNGSWFIGGRRTYFDLLRGALPKSDDGSEVPNFFFYDVNAKISQTLSSRDKLFVSFFRSQDRLDVNQTDLDFDLGISNTTGSLRWTRIIGDNFFSSVNLAGSRYRSGYDGNNTGFEFGAENIIRDYTLRHGLEWFASQKLTFKTGYEITRYEFDYKQNFSGDADSTGNEGRNEGGIVNLKKRDWVGSGFAQVNYQVNPFLSVQAGARANYYDLSSAFVVDPRLAMRYQVNSNFAVKASWGMFHQYLRLASNPDFVFFDSWLPTDNSVPVSRADHYILGFETSSSLGYDFNVDLYYKKLRNVSELNQYATQGGEVRDFFYTGNGAAYGVEFFAQKKIGRFTGWIGYAFGFVNFTFKEINNGQEFRPKYDRRHDFKTVLTFRLSERWEMGAVWSFQTGQSFTGVTSRFQSNLPGDDVGDGVTVPAQRYGLRLPPSHQLNLNFNWNTTFFNLPAKLLIDIYNVYSRRDIWFRYYDTSKNVAEATDVKLLPIIPTVAFEVKF